MISLGALDAVLALAIGYALGRRRGRQGKSS